MSRLARITATYAFCHFVVDLACVATMMGSVSACLGSVGVQERALAVLAYDMLAFCWQLPCGALLDVLGHRRMPQAACCSFALVAAGVLCGWAGGVPASVTAVLLVAAGNALFHCAGGVEVLGESDGRAAPSGEFISTGAAGVFVGSLPAFNGWGAQPMLLCVLLAVSAAFVLVAPHADEPGVLSFSLTQAGWLAVGLLAATVALRSYTGMVMAYPWKATPLLGVVALAAVVAGKAVGGRLADGVGPRLASLVSLGGAALLFPLSWTSVAAGTTATFLFNFTMAITLSALARLLPRARGMAFGIASFSLALGALPALLGFKLASPGALAALSVASLVLLELGLLCADATDGREGRTHA